MLKDTSTTRSRLGVHRNCNCFQIHMNFLNKIDITVNKPFQDIVLVLSWFGLCDPHTVSHQAPLYMGFSRQEYWSGLPYPSPGDLPDPGIEPRSPALQVDSLLSEQQGKPKAYVVLCCA